MIDFIDALILTSEEAHKAFGFYKNLGLPLKEEKHSDGPVHYACDINGAHIAIYQSKIDAKPSHHSSMIGFRVKNLKELVKKMKNSGAEIHTDIQEVPWGQRAILLDPDGRKIELNQS